MHYNIAIVDDHILIAKAISAMLNEEPTFKVLFEVGNGLQLKEKLSGAKLLPDVVLLDISMPIMDGYATSKWLKENYPDILILTLSMQDDDESLIRMIKNGAKGYLLKNVEPPELINAIKRLLEVGYYYPEWAASKVFHSLGQADKNLNPSWVLTEREKEFLQYACTELTYKEIANQMHLSPKTIDGYREDLFLKFDVKSRVGLVLFALKHKLVSL